MLNVRPSKGGFLRPFGCGWFIREFLSGKAPEGSSRIDPLRGAPQSDICFEYKEALARATAREQAEKSISQLVLAGTEVTEEHAEEILQTELKQVSRKFSHMRYHSFLTYFGILKRLGWVEPTGKTEPSAMQENYPEAPPRVYYRLSLKGQEVESELWSNPLCALYPRIGADHTRKLN